MKKGILRFGFVLVVGIILFGCGRENTGSSDTATALNEESLNHSVSPKRVAPVQSCLQNLTGAACPMIAFVNPIVCTADQLLNGMKIQPLRAEGVNSCLAEQQLEVDACNAGLSYAEVQQLDVVCSSPSLSPIPIIVSH